MRLVTFKLNNKELLGVLSNDKTSIVSLENILPNYTMIKLINDFDHSIIRKISLALEDEKTIPLKDVVLESPIPNPPRGIICLGKNYKEHIKEVAKAIDSEHDIPKFPIYFSKLVDRCIGHGGIIPSHENLTNSLDYEVELAIVIGKEGKNIPEDKVEEYIFGYTILNDVSVRDFQRKHVQWFKGKSFDGTCPMGPCIVSKDEFSLPLKLHVKSFVNGELRQNSNTSEFIFDIPRIISEFSKGITLKPGDIIATGTPAGVGMGFNPPRYLKPNDEIECFIENIGTLKNTVL
ncbi:fumarylacetoacetate hydrolase family protein [Clostridium sp. DJ247]|uniref:fumarylacetoacetate hydrolase family protein n=1 Tax=Clostridium sp. DJ247 TaxID=2726188 RepID=UPI001627CEC2|nr:fumarylacetoacetate hydrolase family protein [Clostridium sp. DJ247]MBC2580995.1 fumarylacetoacetate hydrolase family protein [Clostridium sp. DJ247]